MPNYYVNKNVLNTGKREVHQSNCYRLPNPDNIILLGTFKNCKDAVEDAKKHYSNVDGCSNCAKEYHAEEIYNSN